MQKGKIILNREWLICFRRQLKYDNINGILHHWKMVIPVIVLTTFICGKFLSVYYCQAQEFLSLPVPSTGDFIVDMFKGMEKYEPHIKTKPFEIPAFYLFFNLYISYVIARYPLNDLRGMGMNVLVNSRNRSSWIVSKFVWCAEMVLLLYAVTFAIAITCSALSGQVSMHLNTEINISVSNLQLTQDQFFLNVILLPIITSICISYVQLTISFRVSLLAGSIVTIVLICLSAYYSNTFLVGNYLMLLRNSAVIGSGGVLASHGCILSILLSIVSLLLSNAWFAKRDIF